MRKIIIALLLSITVTLTACTESELLEIQTDTTTDTPAPKPEQTEHTEQTAEETTDAVYATVPTSAYSLAAVPSDTKITYEFTEEDQELHQILQDLEPAWKVFGNLITDGLNCIEGYGVGTWVHFSQGAWENDWFYQSLSKELPFDSIDGLTAELNRCFTGRAVTNYLTMLNPVKGVTASKEDGVNEVLLSRYEYMNEFDFNEDGEFLNVPLIMELDGKLYRVAERSTVNSKFVDIDVSKTRVLSQSEDEIDFAYICRVPYEENLIALKGTLRYADGGWKLTGTLDLPLSINITVDILDFYQVWCDKPAAEISVQEGYDPELLEHFDYGRALTYNEGAGDFLDGEYGEFRELYQKAYTLKQCVFDSTVNIPIARDNPNALLTLHVPNENVGSESHMYLMTGFSWGSFYEELLKVFTKEFADQLTANSGLCSYEGGLWYMERGVWKDDDPSRVHTEYAFEMNENAFDIICTSYYDFGADPEFDPDRADEYETTVSRYTFVNTEDGWRCQRFDTV